MILITSTTRKHSQDLDPLLPGEGGGGGTTSGTPSTPGRRAREGGAARPSRVVREAGSQQHAP